MSRRYRTHRLRQVQHLEGIWDFSFLGQVDPDRIAIPSIAFSDRISVPGSFDATPAYAGRRGVAAYRTCIRFADTRRHRLFLDGVHNWCAVFLNDRRLGDHAGGFTRFSFDILPEEPGEAELVILTDNRFDEQRSPLHEESLDWYQYGGITRGAELHRLPELRIDRVSCTTMDHQSRSVRVEIDFGADAPRSDVCRIDWNGRTVAELPVEAGPDPARITADLQLTGAALWSPDSPNLHMIEVSLRDDDFRIRFGIRTIELQDQQILLNGRPLRLIGFNRHESHPQFGHGLPDELIASDIQQLRDLECTFVRGSHYPQDERFLDLCDEEGICVWEEALSWEPEARQLTDERWLRAQERNIDEMIASGHNHPSVIIWGILNEGPSRDPDCRPAYERLFGRIRSRDASRPVSFASSHPHEDLCIDLADIVAVNTFPGWYDGEIEDVPELIGRIFAGIDAAGFRNRPVIVSEVGAGAVPGWRDRHEARWSEQYQAALLERVITYLFMESSRACGLAIWQFCDVRSSQDRNRMMGRPRGFNNKGVVDEYRRPKQAYEVVKTLFTALRR